MYPHPQPRVLGSPFKSPPPRRLPPPQPSPSPPSSFSLLRTAVTSPVRDSTDLTAFRDAVEDHHATNVPRLPDTVPNLDPVLLTLDSPSCVPTLPEGVTDTDPGLLALDSPSYVPRLPEAVTNIDPALLALDNQSSHARAVTLAVDSRVLFGTLHLISGYDYYVNHYPRFFDSWPSDSIGFDHIPSSEIMTMVHSVQGMSWGRSWDFPPWIAIVDEAEAKAEAEKKNKSGAETKEVLEGRETAISRPADSFLAVTDDRGAWQAARDLGTCR